MALDYVVKQSNEEEKYMATEAEVDTDWKCWDDDRLLREYLMMNDSRVLLQSLMLRAEQELYRRMELRGATGIPSNEFECVLEPRYDYDQGRLAALKEVFVEADLAKCLTPEHLTNPELVPDRWDLRKTLPTAKRYGDEALDIVGAATIQLRGRLHVRAREKAAT